MANHHLLNSQAKNNDDDDDDNDNDNNNNNNNNNILADPLFYDWAGEDDVIKAVVGVKLSLSDSGHSDTSLGPISHEFSPLAIVVELNG